MPSSDLFIGAVPPGISLPWSFMFALLLITVELLLLRPSLKHKQWHMNHLPCRALMLKYRFLSISALLCDFRTNLCKSGETRFLFLRTWSFVGTPDVIISRWFCPLFISERLFIKLLVVDDEFGMQNCCWVPVWIKSSALSRGEYDSASSETLCR